MRSKKEINTDVYKAGIVILTEGKANTTVISTADLRMHKYEYYIFLLGELEKLNVIEPQYSYTRPRRILMCLEEFIKQYEPEQPELKIYETKLIEDFQRIDKMDGVVFERFCCSLLLQNGYYNVDITKVNGDQGVDILAEKDDIRYAIQCKCFTSDLGNTSIQEIYAGKEMYDCHVGVVMTNRHFTPGAKALAKKTRIILWDRDKLASLIENTK